VHILPDILLHITNGRSHFPLTLLFLQIVCKGVLHCWSHSPLTPMFSDPPSTSAIWLLKLVELARPIGM